MRAMSSWAPGRSSAVGPIPDLPVVAVPLPARFLRWTRHDDRLMAAVARSATL
jgi:hypothetical protein